MMGHRRPSVLKMATPMPSSTGASWANRHHQPLDGQVTRNIGQCMHSEEASVHAHSTVCAHCLRSFKQHARLKDMVLLRNKPPKWNEQLGAYCLNFSGRVTAASVKNFQLIEEGDASERVVLQYGKVTQQCCRLAMWCMQRQLQHVQHRLGLLSVGSRHLLVLCMDTNAVQ